MPFESSLILSSRWLHSADQIDDEELLSVRKITNSFNVPSGRFAFLSACHSAAIGKISTPDEVIHLSTSLQFVGYCSVIGTLWMLLDNIAPMVSKRFYENL